MQADILFLVDSSSQLKPAWLVAQELSRTLSLSAQGVVIPNPSAPVQRQVVEAGVDVPMMELSVEELVERPEFWNCRVVVAYLAASRLYRLRRYVALSLRRRERPGRPLLVTGYNGVVFEKHLEGLMWRIGYDLICVNSRKDEELFSGFLRQLGCSTRPLVRTGFPLAQVNPRTPVSVRPRSKDILFATQNVVPSARRERVYLLQVLARLAAECPDRKVIIKPRGAPGERTLHEEKFHYVDLLRKEVRTPPPNLEVDYGPLPDFLDRVGVVATVSSTAALEAIGRGVPAAVLTDLGIKESLGNHFFVGSGLLTTLEELRRGAFPTPEPAWLDANGMGGTESLQTLPHRVQKALADAEGLSSRLPLMPALYGPETSPGLDELVMWTKPPRRIIRENMPTHEVDTADWLRKSLRRATHFPLRFLREALRSDE